MENIVSDKIRSCNTEFMELVPMETVYLFIFANHVLTNCTYVLHVLTQSTDHISVLIRPKYTFHMETFSVWFVCLFVFYVSSTARSFRRHPHLLSLAKDVKLGKYTVPTGNRTPAPFCNFWFRRSMFRKYFFPIILPSLLSISVI